MKRKKLAAGFLVLMCIAAVTAGYISAMPTDICREMDFTLVVHNQTAHSIEVESVVQSMCNQRDAVVHDLKTIPREGTLEMKFSGTAYKFDSKTYVTFETKRVVHEGPGRLTITNHIKKKYVGSELTGRHDIYLNQNLAIMPF